MITLHRYRYQLFIKTANNLSPLNKKKQNTDKTKMSQVIDIFTIDSLQINETVFRASDSSPSIDDNHSTSSQPDILLTQTSNSSPTPYWRPSDRFQKNLRILHED